MTRQYDISTAGQTAAFDCASGMYAGLSGESSAVEYQPSKVDDAIGLRKTVKSCRLPVVSRDVPMKPDLTGGN
jgi:hypothetical protein